jgi:hypothetical protein
MYGRKVRYYRVLSRSLNILQNLKQESDDSVVIVEIILKRADFGDRADSWSFALRLNGGHKRYSLPAVVKRREIVLARALITEIGFPAGQRLSKESACSAFALAFIL